MEEEKKIVLYTVHCPRCNVLEKKLDMQGVKYEICEDIEAMHEMGVKTAPILKVGEEIMEFGQAVNWLKTIKMGAR